VDAAGLVAVVAGILAIGLLGDDGGRDQAPPPTTTTTTVGRPGPAPTLTGTPTSVATTPIAVGRALAQDTGTTLLVLGQGRPRLFDVDTGVLREGGPTGVDAVGVRGAFLFSDPNGVTRQPADGGPSRPFDAEGQRLGGQLVTAGPDRVWLTTESDDGGLMARELGADSTPTHRQLSLP
jgi:hypothetical protein